MNKEKLQKIILKAAEYLLYFAVAEIIFIAIVYAILEMNTETSLIWTKKIISIPRSLLLISLFLAIMLGLIGLVNSFPDKPGFFLKKEEQENDESKNE